MKNAKPSLKKLPIFFLILLASFSVKSQQIDLKDYCIVGYYASTATSKFKTPFIYNFGENNTFEYLEVEGKIQQGKYSVIDGNLKFEFIGGEFSYKIKGETLTPANKRTFALLQKKIFGNRLKNNRYTGILYKEKSTVAVRTNYQFIGNKFSVTDEKGTIVQYTDYDLVGNLAGYKLYGLKSKILRSVFVLYGDQLVVINIYRDKSEGATFGILDQVN